MMSPTHVLLLVGLMALTGCRRGDEGAVKLTVSYAGFKPGCIRVGVRDAQGAGGERTTELPGKGEASGGAVRVAAFREAGWSPTLALRAEAFETRCQGAPVSTAAVTVTVDKGEVAETELKLAATDGDLDGYVSPRNGGTDCDDTRAQVHPGQTERCNDSDDDCDGAPDDGLDVGLACTGPGGCGGQRACAPDGGVVCDSPAPTVLYPDNDRDTRGAANAPVTSCEPTRPGHVSNANDCDDTRANVYQGAPELCDELDNDCDGAADEGLGVGTSCDPGLGCTGARACETDGGIRCAFVTSPSTYYPDDDLDQRGKTDAGVRTCAQDAGYILTAGDCNDGNPFTHANAQELCDLEDNDCDGTADEGGVCPNGGGRWVEQTLGSGTWRTVSLWGDGGVWIAGGGDDLRLREPGQTAFQNLDGRCTGTWYGSWADPRDGVAYLGGSATKSASHAPGATSCNPGLAVTNTDVQGLFGVPLTGGGFEVHAVGLAISNPDGQAHWWEGGTLRSGPTRVAPLWDVHGLSREVLFAVGGQDDTAPRIYRFQAGQNDWKTELVQNIPGVASDWLRGVWVVNPQLAYAVGESSSVLRWNGTSWSKHSAPAEEDLLSVLAFGTSSVYVVTGSGRVYRFDGSTWNELFQVSGRTPLWDIAGTGPDDIWVVGNNGKVAHWPE